MNLSPLFAWFGLVDKWTVDYELCGVVIDCMFLTLIQTLGSGVVSSQATEAAAAVNKAVSEAQRIDSGHSILFLLLFNNLKHTGRHNTG